VRINLSKKVPKIYIADFLRKEKQKFLGKKTAFELNPIDFIVDTGLTLWPMQKFALKLLYCLELSSEDLVPIREYPTDEVTAYTEPDLLNYLYDNKMCNIDYDKYEELRKEGKKFTEALFLWGRKASKSTLAALVMSYRAAELSYMGLPDGDFTGADTIVEVIISQSKQQANDVLSIVTGMSQQSSYLSPRLDALTPRKVKIPYTVGEEIVDMSKLEFRGYGAKPGALRGPLAHTVILDEAAHFAKQGGSRSVEEVYEAAKPAMAPFGINRLLFMITSPSVPSGLVYDRYNVSLDSDYSTLMLRLPTWYVNPTIKFEVLHEEELKNPISFKAEYGAEFIMTSSPYITYDSRELFESCFATVCPEIGPNYMGVDLGLVNDYTGIAIASRDRENINVVYAEEIQPDGQKALDKDTIINIIVKLVQRFKVKSVRIDQYGGTMFLQDLGKRGIKHVTIPVASRENYEMYKFFEFKYRSGDLKIVDDELISDRFKALTRRPTANQTFRVESSHDDLPDAIARAVWEAGHDETYSPAPVYIDANKINKGWERYYRKQQMDLRRRMLYKKG